MALTDLHHQHHEQKELTMQNTTPITTDLDLSPEQEQGVTAAVQHILSISEDMDVAQHDPATHTSPVNLRRPLVLIDHATVTEPDDGPGDLTVHVRAVTYQPEGEQPLPRPGVDWYLSRQGQKLPSTPKEHPDYGMKFIAPYAVTEGVSIVGVSRLPGRRAALPGGVNAELTVARIRLAA